MKISIALICLVGPSLYLLLRYFREYGPSFGRKNGTGFSSALAVIVLLAHVFITLNGRLAEILNAEFFPFRGFLFFALSGVAYGAAIFPRLLLDSSDFQGKLAGSRFTWVVAGPAWIWIAVLVGLAGIQYAG